jgi:hypothetical protein
MNTAMFRAIVSMEGLPIYRTVTFIGFEGKKNTAVWILGVLLRTGVYIKTYNAVSIKC